jgi:uncharacterized protein (DUF1697 family)
MPRYVALLRGVSPMNASMPELKRCFENAGFSNVKTVLSSGNVVFDARKATDASLQKRCEAAMQAELERSFLTIVRSVEFLQGLLAQDPYASFKVPPQAKRVVTFLRDVPAKKLALPIGRDGARILCMTEREVFTAYEASDKGPVFMTLIEKAFGTDITTRTWDTVRKCANA